MRRITWTAVGLLVVVLVCVLALPTASRYLFRKGMLDAVEQGLGVPVRYASMHSEGDSLIVTGLVADSGDAEEPPFSLREARIHYPSGWWPFGGGSELQVDLAGLRLHVDRLPSRVSTPSPWLALMGAWGNASFHVADGELFWRGSGDTTYVANLEASLNLGRAGVKGSGRATGASGLFEINGEMDAQGSHLSLHCENASCALVQSCLGCFGIVDHDVYTVGGIADGDLSVRLSGMRPTEITGQLSIRHLKTFVTPMGLALEIPELKLVGDGLTENILSLGIHGRALVETIGAHGGNGRWAMEALKGRLWIEPDGDLLLSLRSQWWHHNEAKALRIDAKSPSTGGFRADSRWIASDGHEGAISWVQESSQQIRLDLSDVEASELDLFRRVAASRYSAVQDWELSQGRVSGVVLWKPRTIEMQQVQGEAIVLNTSHGNVTLMCDEVVASLSLGQQGLDGSLLLDGGTVSAGESAGKQRYTEGVNADITFLKGHLQRAELSGAIPNGRGRWHVLSGDNVQVELALQGSELANLYPRPSRAAAAYVFDDNKLQLSTTITKNGSDWNINGVAALSGKDGDDHCELSGVLSVVEGMPTLTALQMKASDLSLERYVAPLLPPRFALSCLGRMDLEGAIEEGKLTLALDLNDTVLENSAFRLEIPSLCLPGDCPPKLPAYVTWDLKSGATLVRVPLKAARLVDKRHDIAFDDLYAVVEMDESQLRASYVEAVSNDVVFGGAGVVAGDLWSSAPLTISGHLHKLDGSLESLKKLLHTLDEGAGFVHALPIEGQVSLDDGADNIIRAELNGDLKLREASLSGAITQGRWRSRSDEVALLELESHFVYSYPLNTLEFSHLQGTVAVGKPHRKVEEYSLVGDHIRLLNYPYGSIEFDLWCGDHVRDLVRMVGRGESTVASPSIWQFEFDLENTHLGDMHPKKMELSLNDWSQVDAFAFEVDFSLETVLRDVQRVSRTGLLNLHPSAERELQKLRSASGNFRSNVSYDSVIGLVGYQVTASDVHINDNTVDRFCFCGSVRGDQWIVDQLKVDDLSFSGDVIQQPDRWHVNFLGLRWAQIAMLGLEGDFYTETGVFDARVNLLEGNLHQLTYLSSAPAWLRNLYPAGEVRAQGMAKVTLLPSPLWWHIEADLHALLRSVNIGGLRFQDVRHVPVRYDTNEGVVVGAMSTKVFSSAHKGPGVALDFDGLLFYPSVQNLVIDNVRFEVPHAAMGWLAQKIADASAQPVGGLGKVLFGGPSHGATIVGNVSADIAPGRVVGRVQLDDSLELVSDAPYRVKGGRLDYDPYELRAELSMQYLGRPLWMVLKNKCPLSPYGELLFFEKAPDHGGATPLTVHWERDDQGLFVRDARGRLFGVDVDLRGKRSHRMRNQPIKLEGVVTASAKDLTDILPKEFQGELHRWHIDAHYQLNGEWAAEGLLFDHLSFDGTVAAKDIVVAGCFIDSFQGALSLNPNACKFTNTTISDVSGKITIPELALTRVGTKQWLVAIPEIKGTNIAPAALRHEKERTRRRKKELTLSEVTVRNISGDLRNPRSFAGEGAVHFQLQSRRKSGKGLAGFTADLMAHVGLDADLLTPSSGSVEFEMGQGCAVITKLRNVYSKGKVAKFYLPKDAPPAIVGYDGSLSMQVRMKPTQSVLKLTDKVTLDIGGTIKHPTYTVKE